MKHIVYMDHNATAPLRAEAREAILATLDLGGNPSSVHSAGRKARRVVEDARELVRAAVHAPKTAQVIFTSGGTEANTLALNGVTRALTSSAEHASILKARDDMQTVPVDGNGKIDLGHLQDSLSNGDGNAVVSVMMANNETGVLQNINDIAHLAHRYGALLHVDAVQALGKVHVDFVALGVDMMSLSAHKVGGPMGAGALVASKDVKLVANNPGGGQEGGLRGGTENVSGLAGFGVAAGMAVAELAEMDAVKILRDQLEQRVLEIAPNAMIFGKNVDRLPNTSFIALPGVLAESQIMAMDLAGICVSAGSACSSGKSLASATLAAMGVPETLAKSAIRVSLGHSNVNDDIESFLSVWKDLYERNEAKQSAA